MAGLTDAMRQKGDCNFITNLNMIHECQTDKHVQILLKSKLFDKEAKPKHEMHVFTHFFNTINVK